MRGRGVWVSHNMLLNMVYELFSELWLHQLVAQIVAKCVQAMWLGQGIWFVEVQYEDE